MNPNPLIGVVFHWIGGLSSASFYVPYKGVRHWSWEIIWLTGGVFSWVVGPWLFAALQTHDLLGVLAAAPPRTIFWCYVFGALWGLGGLTFGLTLRYLGMSLGMAVALGLTTAFGTLAPPLFAGEFAEKLLNSSGGRVILLGIAVTLCGIVLVGRAGRLKEAELTREQQLESVREFDFRKGVLIAIFSGVMSSCFAYGVGAGAPIRELGIGAGTGPLWRGLPVLCVVLAGGFTTNFVWCLYLIRKHRSAGQWLGAAAATSATLSASVRPPLLRNYLLCALGGLLWYFQFFFYTMGESQMGRYGFSSWTLHMASIILFSTLWGFAFKEWSAASVRTRATVLTGIGVLVGATLIIGYGNWLLR